MEFGQRFRLAREKRGLEQKDAAAALDISPSYLSKIERGERRPNVELIIKAAEVYKIHEGFFFSKGEEININDLYTKSNTDFISDLGNLSETEIQEKYNITIDGKTVTPDELKSLIAYVRMLRQTD